MNQKDSRQAGMTTNGAQFTMHRYTIILLIALILNVAMLHPAAAADTSIVSVSATVVSKNNCKFNSATAALAFGNLDPANPVNKTVNTSVTFRCMGSSPMATFFIGDDDGLNESGPNANRMKHSTIGTEYIPYMFTLNPTSGTVPKNTVQTLTISGTVNGTDYQNAATGTYSDTVVITLAP
jgi:spore coat protein U-like protein